MAVQRKCKECFVEFKVSPSVKKLFCSKACWSKNCRRSRIYKCTYCSKDYDCGRTHPRLTSKPFCSKECFTKYNIGKNNPAWKGVAENYSCLMCKSDFLVNSNYWKKTGPKYCSHQCKLDFYKLHRDKTPGYIHGGKLIYPQEWNVSYRESIRKRDEYICQLCYLPQELNKRNLSVHHIDHNKKNGDKNNCISLCLACHNKVHSKKNQEEWKIICSDIIQRNNEYLIRIFPISHEMTQNGFIV